jgi:hypothetical protein
MNNDFSFVAVSSRVRLARNLVNYPFGPQHAGNGEIVDLVTRTVKPLGDFDLVRISSLTPEQAQLLRPSVAVASAGAHNSYGHPDPACVQALEAVGTRYLCTKDCGDVTLYARGGLAPGTSPPRHTTI